MSKSSGRSPANGKPVRRRPPQPPVPSSPPRTPRTTKHPSYSETKRRLPSNTSHTSKAKKDPIEQTIEEVIARSLAEWQQTSPAAAADREEPSSQPRRNQGRMRQKRQPQKRQEATLVEPSTAIVNGGIINVASTSSPAESTLSPVALPQLTSFSKKSSSIASSSTSKSGSKVPAAGLTNGKTHSSSKQRSSSPANHNKRRSILPDPSPPTTTTTTPVNKLGLLLSKKRKRTESPMGSSSSGAAAAKKINTAGQNHHHHNATSTPLRVPAVKKRKLESLLHKRGINEKSTWTFRGKSFLKTLYSKVEKRNMERLCYNAVRHEDGEIFKVGDCVLLRAPKGQEPHVGKVAAFWADERGDMMMTIFWFWRPEEVDVAIRQPHGAMEVYVSSLRDENFVNCINEKCFVLTAHQYARFMARSKLDDTLYRRPKRPFVPSVNSPINALMPDAEIDPEIVYFADKGFDGRSNRFWEYYFRGSKLRKCYMD